MSLYREWKNSLPFDPAERVGGWDLRSADDPQLTRLSLALGAALAVCLATGGGLAPRVEWGAACFFGLVTAVFALGLLLAWRHLTAGGWRARRRHRSVQRRMSSRSRGSSHTPGCPTFGARSRTMTPPAQA